MAFIECRDLHFSYSGESGEVLHGVDLDIEKGSFVALLGHNGCGKSTMFASRIPPATTSGPATFLIVPWLMCLVTRFVNRCR